MITGNEEIETLAAIWEQGREGKTVELLTITLAYSLRQLVNSYSKFAVPQRQLVRCWRCLPRVEG
jgi:hypothetical protein